MGGNAECYRIGIGMRFVPLFLLLVLWARDDHKRPNRGHNTKVTFAYARKERRANGNNR